MTENLENLADLSYEELQRIYREDMELLRSENIPAEVAARHALKTRDLLPFFTADRNNRAIIQAVEKNIEKLTQEQRKEIESALSSRTGFPTFSKDELFVGKQAYYGGGGYFTETIFLPGLAVQNFIKKYSDPKEMKKHLDLVRRMSRIEDIDNLTIPPIGADEKNSTVTYSHSGENILQHAKTQKDDAVLKGLNVNLSLAFLLTRNKNVFKRDFDEALYHRQRHVFSRQPGLEQQMLYAVRELCPEMPKENAKNIAKRFRTGKEQKFIMPEDPRTSNTIIDSSTGKAKVCDLDGLTCGPIFSLLHGYLEKMGSFQPEERKLVEHAARKIFVEQKGNRKHGEKTFIEGFVARYELERPVQNLTRANRFLERAKRPYFKENKKLLEDIALLYFNRALADLGNLGMDSEMREISEKSKRPRLDDGDYAKLETELGIDSKDYATVMDLKRMRSKVHIPEFIFEPEPWTKRAWDYVKSPVAVGLGLAAFIGGAALIASFAPKSEEHSYMEYLNARPSWAEIQKLVSGSDFDYCRLHGQTKGCDEAEKNEQVAKYLKEYIITMNLSKGLTEYNYLFGCDYKRPPVIGDKRNADSHAMRMSSDWGLPPQYLRAAISASLSSPELKGRARENDYFGNVLTLPLETINYINKVRGDEEEENEYWAEKPQRDFEIISVGMQAMTVPGTGYPIDIYARLFAGPETLDTAQRKAGSVSYEDYSEYLPEIARELTERAIAFHPFMAEDAAPFRETKKGWISSGEDYSWEYVMVPWLVQNDFLTENHNWAERWQPRDSE